MFFGLSVIFCSISYFQNRDSWTPPPFPFVNRNLFYTDPLVFYTKDSTNARLDLYIELPVNNLLFKRNSVNENFESSIVISININDLTGQSVIDKTYTENISYTDDEMKREAKNSIFYIKEYSLKPDSYLLSVLIRDNNLNKDYHSVDSIFVKNLRNSDILLSDIMILSHYSTDENGKKEITPLVSNNVFGLKDFYIFFEIYKNSDSAINKDYTYRIKDSKDKIISEGTFAYFLKDYINKEFERLDFINHEPGFFKLELMDNLTREIVAQKNFAFFPNHPMGNQFQREGHKPRN